MNHGKEIYRYQTADIFDILISINFNPDVLFAYNFQNDFECFFIVVRAFVKKHKQQ